MSSAKRYVPTLFDRLRDDHPHQLTDVAEKRLCSLSDYKAGIVRDLEILVNTRQCLINLDSIQYPCLSGSLLEYGMPDFTTRGVLNPEDRQLVQAQLERAITIGDGRFKEVRVRLLEQKIGHRMLTFRVDASLRIHDAKRKVTFDAVLEVNTQEYKVQNLT